MPPTYCCYSCTYVPRRLVEVLFSCAYYEQMDSRLVFLEDDDNMDTEWDEDTETYVENPWYKFDRLPKALQSDWECGLRMVLELDLCFGGHLHAGHFFDLLACDMIWDEDTDVDNFECVVNKEFLQETIEGKKTNLLCYSNSLFCEKRRFYSMNLLSSDLTLVKNKLIGTLSFSRHTPFTKFSKSSLCQNYVFDYDSCKVYVYEDYDVSIYSFKPESPVKVVDIRFCKGPREKNNETKPVQYNQ